MLAATLLLCASGPFTVQVMYSGPDLAADRPRIEQLVYGAGKVVRRSAAKHGYMQDVRWATGPDCNLSVKPTDWQPHYFWTPTSNMPDATVKYLVFSRDYGSPCGQAMAYPDTRPGAVNDNDGNKFAAGIIRNCGWNRATVAHELGHLLGGVQNAPTLYGWDGYHCLAQGDPMCYSPVGSKTCPNYFKNWPLRKTWDCHGDWYYNPAPKPGSWLASHWNLATSGFLTTPVKVEK
jgi:hypothetical protein